MTLRHPLPSSSSSSSSSFSSSSLVNPNHPCARVPCCGAYAPATRHLPQQHCLQYPLQQQQRHHHLQQRSASSSSSSSSSCDGEMMHHRPQHQALRPQPTPRHPLQQQRPQDPPPSSAHRAHHHVHASSSSSSSFSKSSPHHHFLLLLRPPPPELGSSGVGSGPATGVGNGPAAAAARAAEASLLFLSAIFIAVFPSTAASAALPVSSSSFGSTAAFFFFSAIAIPRRLPIELRFFGGCPVAAVTTVVSPFFFAVPSSTSTIFFVSKADFGALCSSDRALPTPTAPRASATVDVVLDDTDVSVDEVVVSAFALDVASPLAAPPPLVRAISAPSSAASSDSASLSAAALSAMRFNSILAIDIRGAAVAEDDATAVAELVAVGGMHSNIHIYIYILNNHE